MADKPPIILDADFPPAKKEDQQKWDLDQAKAEAEVEKQRAGVVDFQQLIVQRGRFAKLFVWVAIGWLAFVAITIILTALSPCPFKFELSDNIIIVLLGTGTINVLAPAVLVAKYLFGNPR